VRTTGEVLVKNIPGLEQVLVIYPYVVEAASTVVAKSRDTKMYDAHFGLVLTTTSPCTNGYQGTKKRAPQERFDNPAMNDDARCLDPPTKSNSRGAQNLPRVGTATARPDAFFDADTGKLTFTDPTDADPVAPWASGGTVAPRSLGKESWKWLYLQPMTGQ
jgi:phospholipid/cholesterol/gamma-HCH transport system substrate-binding protein